MSLKVYSKIAASITIIALLYIHMQMKIFELSYNGKDKEKIIHELNDSNGALSHQILTLKSANNLGNQLLDHDNSLQFMNRGSTPLTVPLMNCASRPLPSSSRWPGICAWSL